MFNELLTRLQRDRYDETQLSQGGDAVLEPVQRRWFNNGMDHACAVAEQWAKEQAVLAGLRELASAPAVDMRLRDAMILGAASPSAELFTPPAVAQIASTYDVGRPGNNSTRDASNEPGFL